MVKEIVEEDNGEGTSSRMDEDIHSMFDFYKTCLFLHL
jgi:hypothetical protein